MIRFRRKPLHRINSLSALGFTAKDDASRGSEKARTFEFIAVLLLKKSV
jgi:hypothetical protein